MPKYENSTVTGRLGELYVERIAVESGWIPRPILKDDMGIDMLVEYTQAGRPTGELVALQVKAGASYWNKKRTRCRVPLEPKVKDWALYWQNYCLPVVLVVYDQDADRAAWFDVHSHFLKNPEAVSRPSLAFNAQNWFTKEALQTEFTALTARVYKPGQPGLPDYVRRMASIVLDGCLQVLDGLHAIDYDPTTDEGFDARHALRHEHLPFEGQITCMDSKGYCTVHNDRRLVGERISRFRDINGRYVFAEMATQQKGSIQWIDDFDSGSIDPGAGVEDYLRASTEQPTRVTIAIFDRFVPWGWYVIVEAHSRIWGRIGTVQE